MALDALRFLSGPDIEKWRRLFLKQHVPYLQGAKEPDTKFRDFQNHVVHVEQNNWGGAAKSAELWFERAVTQLRRGDWVNGVYAAGILSHYYTDPIQPFHTGQSQAEQNIHRAAEWSITKSYADLWAIAERDNFFVDVEVPAGSQWLREMVHAGAATSHPYYDELIEHYDFAAGSKNPPKGLDDHSRRILARLIAYAVVGFSRILGRLIREASVTPPDVNLTLETVVSTINVPVAYVVKQIADRQERAQVKAMFDEYQRTGRVSETLDEDSRTIQRLVAERDGTQQAASQQQQPRREALAPSLSPARSSSQRPSLSPAATSSLLDRASDAIVTHSASSAPDAQSSQTESLAAESPSPLPKLADDLAAAVASLAPKARESEPINESPVPVSTTAADDEPMPVVEQKPAREAAPRTYLSPTNDIVDAPSIGPKMAERFYACGLNTVRDLLTADPDRACVALNIKQLTPDLFRIWQSQAQLCCDIPGLRGHDAQILVACGYRTVEAIAAADHDALTKAAIAIVSSPAGQRVLRGSNPPDADEVAFWIQSAQTRTQSQRAAA